MEISNDIIADFVKATNDTPAPSTESTVYGTAKIQGDTVYAQLDGSDILTPVTATVGVKDGDRVMVLLKNHTATVTNNLTTPSASSADIKDMSEVASKITELEIAVAKKVSTDALDAESARIDSLVADNAVIKDELRASEADISKLQASYLTVTEELTASKASIESLEADIANLDAVSAKDLEAINADIYNLKSVYGQIENLDATYAAIDLANVETADIGTLFAKVGLITDATIVDGHITGFLDAVEVNANKITAGMLSVDRLIFRGSENSIIYELNNITGALQAVQGDTLNGEILTDRSINVDKIVAHSITANEIAAGTITASELATNAVTADKISAGVITAEKIASKTLTAEQIDVDSLFAETITATGTITGVQLVGSTISGSTIESVRDVELKLRIEDGVLNTYYDFNNDGPWQGIRISDDTIRFFAPIDGKDTEVAYILVNNNALEILSTAFSIDIGDNWINSVNALSIFPDEDTYAMAFNVNTYCQGDFHMSAGHKMSISAGSSLTIPTSISGSNVPIATALTLSEITDVKSYPSFIGSCYVGSTWKSVISARHRNGINDGTSYGLTLHSDLVASGDLYWNKQYGTATWQASRTILDSVNCGSYTCEYKSDANGKYYKFADGTLICTKVVTFNATLTSPWGSMFESGYHSLGNWAHNFKEVPTVNVMSAFTTAGGSACFVEGVWSVSTTSAGQCYIARPVSTAANTYSLHVIGIGRWK